MIRFSRHLVRPLDFEDLSRFFQDRHDLDLAQIRRTGFAPQQRDPLLEWLSEPHSQDEFQDWLNQVGVAFARPWFEARVGRYYEARFDIAMLPEDQYRALIRLQAHHETELSKTLSEHLHEILNDLSEQLRLRQVIFMMPQRSSLPN